jgi:ferredoxin-NADP reductase
VAVQKTARVAAVTEVSASTRLIELLPSERLDFVGGQYLICNSGIQLLDGKLAKRAYSIVSSDVRQQRLTLAVRRIGPGSSWMHGRAPGDEVPFSGPWGKFLADDAQPRRTLVLATDTGITAALGLVCGRAFAPQRPAAQLIWLVEHDDYFLPDALVRALLPAGLAYRREPLPPVGDAARVPAALALARALDHRFDSVFLVGDGDVIHALRAECFPDARLESFFRNPEKKSQ